MSQRKIEDGIIEACQQGDREALRQVFEAYKDRVYSIALYFFSGDEASAKDLTQDVFLKLIGKIEQFRHDAEFATWLYRLVSNACMDEQRRRRRFLSLTDAVEVGAMAVKESQEEHRLQVEVADSVKAAVAALKPKLRMVILLKYFDDLSYDEMAKVLGCTKGTVASRLNRSHKILARKLAHWRDALAPGEQKCLGSM